MMITEFGETIKLIRFIKGDKLNDMARKVGLSHSQVSAIEHGRRSMKDDYISKIQEAYNLPDALAYKLILLAIKEL